MATEVTFERFHELTGMPLSVVWDYFNGRAPVKWDSRDVRPLTRAQVLITMHPGNAAGEGKRPRTIPNPEYWDRKKKRSVHVPGRRGAVQVDAVKDPAIAGMPHPSTEDIQGDPSLSVVRGEGMPEGFQVLRRARRTPHAAKE